MNGLAMAKRWTLGSSPCTIKTKADRQWPPARPPAGRSVPARPGESDRASPTSSGLQWPRKNERSVGHQQQLFCDQTQWVPLLPVCGDHERPTVHAPVRGVATEPRCRRESTENKSSIGEGKDEEALPPVESPAAPEKAGSVSQIARFEPRLAVWACADANGIHRYAPPPGLYGSCLSGDWLGFAEPCTVPVYRPGKVVLLETATVTIILHHLANSTWTEP